MKGNIFQTFRMKINEAEKTKKRVTENCWKLVFVLMVSFSRGIHDVEKSETWKRGLSIDVLVHV